MMSKNSHLISERTADLQNCFGPVARWSYYQQLYTKRVGRQAVWRELTAFQGESAYISVGRSEQGDWNRSTLGAKMEGSGKPASAKRFRNSSDEEWQNIPPILHRLFRGITGLIFGFHTSGHVTVSLGWGHGGYGRVYC